MSKYSYDFGRVFFLDKSNPVPDRIYFQPLGNHVGNVRKLVRAWLDLAPESKARVDEAARIHDIGKPQKFKIEVKTTPAGKFKEYSYSFKGHRFVAVSPNNSWAQALARGHHDFSVGDISRDSYILKKEYNDILVKNPLAYAEELYILEMCDQIEAELACRTIGDDKQANSRTFMEYSIISENEYQFIIDPCPFKGNKVNLSFAYWTLNLSNTDKRDLEIELKKEDYPKLETKINQIIKQWWENHQGKASRAEIKKGSIIKYNFNEQEKLNWDCKIAYEKLGGDKFQPNPMQKDMFKAIDNDSPPAILLKSPTGSGKTESVLFPALARGYRLFLPLPARSLLEDQKERIEKYLIEFSRQQPDREISLVVDTGSQMYRWVYRNGNYDRKPNVNYRRHLYKGDVVLTTLDKFLYRYFAFGDKQKSFIFPLRINQNKTLICFDESHYYDGLSFTNFHNLVRALYEAGRSLVLMTATMPSQLSKDYFSYLETIDYIDDIEKAQMLKQRCGQKSFTWLPSISANNLRDECVQIIVNEYQRKEKPRIIFVVERVSDAIEIYKQVKQRLNLQVKEQYLFLYHGRIADQVRPELYQKIQECDRDSDKPYILITTSAIEVGCDLNCNVLISQICPPENLIQRAGRCNRRGNFTDAKVILVGDRIPDFTNSLDESGWLEYQIVLQELKEFDSTKISKCISRHQQVDDYRAIELFSMLHDYVYHSDLTCQSLHERGLIPTRSWEPSVNLQWNLQMADKDEIRSISVPISRFCHGEKFTNVRVFEKWYDKDYTVSTEKALEWGSAYSKEIIVKLELESDRTFLAEQYDEELGFIKIPRIFSKKWIDGAEVKLLYIEGDRKAVITYIKSINEKSLASDDKSSQDAVSI